MTYAAKQSATSAQSAAFSPLHIAAAPWNSTFDCDEDRNKKQVTRTFATLFFEPLTLTRAQWLWVLNLVCFIAHQTMAILCFTACYGIQECTPEGMSIKTHRIISNWTNPGINGYSKEVVETSFSFRYDILAAAFFQLSALFHGVWVILGIIEAAGVESAANIACTYYYDYIDDALCYWRYARVASPAPHLLVINCNVTVASAYFSG